MSTDRQQDTSDLGAWRTLDAAANRAAEGMRVVEDFARFGLDDRHLTRLAKELRHQLATVSSALPWPERLAARETLRDVGTSVSTATEQQRLDTWQVCLASLQRAKQALRSLEEFSKVVSAKKSVEFESLRYQLYTLERCLGITQASLQRLANVRLCVLVDGRESLEEFRKLISAIVAGGAGMIQLRDKSLSDAELIERGRALVQLAKATDSEVPVAVTIINDRPDVAVAVEADGVHVGQDDMCVKDARAIVGPRKLVGVSTHNLQQAKAAVLDGADYLGAGPTFPSRTKAFKEFAGLEFLQQVADEVRLPTFAIGGISAENIAKVASTGIARVAVSGAIVDASEPSVATIAMQQALTAAAESAPTAAGG